MSSRVARKPIPVPKGVEIRIQDALVSIKGAKGELTQSLPNGVDVKLEDQQLMISAQKGVVNADALAGTIRALLNNNVKGVTEGFSKKLQLVGVGYRAQLAQVKGSDVLSLTLGLSHPVSYVAPKGISLACPAVTEIVVSGLDKQLVGQVAADIRSICGGIREPEPYKGKGIRYSDEVIELKETKKK